MNKPILIGQNNPLSTAPGHELYPLPEGCTGHRIWVMLHGRTRATTQQYLDTFERRNLVRGIEYDRVTAVTSAGAMIDELQGTGRTVVLLGAPIREAFARAMRSRHDLFSVPDGERMLPPLLVHPVEAGGCTWRQIPHPSGRNLFYNEPRNREVVAMLLEELYVSYNKREKETA